MLPRHATDYAYYRTRDLREHRRYALPPEAGAEARRAAYPRELNAAAAGGVVLAGAALVTFIMMTGG
jgi:hypothetical protein